jgi:hypothetical protein
MKEYTEVMSTPTFVSLVNYCKFHPELTMREIVDEAVLAWMLRQRGQAEAAGGHGYRWKTVFLPAGTDSVRRVCSSS